MKKLLNTSTQWVTVVLTLCITVLSIQLAAQTNSRGINIQAKTQQPQPVFNKGVYHALIMGNNQYRDINSQWRPLKTAVTDAETLAGLLSNEYGFEDVVVLKDASRREMLLALNQLSQRIQPDDSVLVYYAGHGFLDDETQRGFWVPVDAVGGDHTTYLRNSTIRDEMSVIASRAKHTLLVSDSCFSGSLLSRGAKPVIPETGADRYYQKVADKKSVQIITAGGIEYVDDDYRGSGHSPFTYFLLNELKHNNQPVITVSELSSNVEKAVANNVDQVPASGVLQGAGDELGEFIFLKLNISVDVQGIPKENVSVDVNVEPQSSSGSIPVTIDIKRKPEKQLDNLPLPTL